MILTEHAIQRWSERFSDSNLEQTYLNANCRVGRKTRKKITLSCPMNTEYTNGVFKGRYYRMTKDNIVFVMAPPETIITVFKLL